jgi:hypothetical protein
MKTVFREIALIVGPFLGHARKNLITDEILYRESENSSNNQHGTTRIEFIPFLLSVPLHRLFIKSCPQKCKTIIYKVDLRMKVCNHKVGM